MNGSLPLTVLIGFVNPNTKRRDPAARTLRKTVNDLIFEVNLKANLFPVDASREGIECWLSKLGIGRL